MLVESFAYGSSFPVVAIPLLLLSMYVPDPRPVRFPYELFVLSVLCIYGLIGIANYIATYIYTNNISYIIGVVSGVILVCIDAFQLNTRNRLFNISQQDAWQYYTLFIVLHIFIIRCIMTPLQFYIQ